MKKFFTYLLAFAAMATAISCSKSDGPEEPVPGPTITWASNPDFDKMDITDKMDVKIKVEAPAGIKTFKVAVESEVLKAMGITELDLIEPGSNMEIVKMIWGNAGSPKDKTSYTLDISNLVPMINTLTTEESDHKFTVRIVDKNDQTATKTAVFHRVAEENPTVSFNEADVPIFIPFAGNSYMTTPPASSEIDNYTGKFKYTWMDEKIVSSTYFHVGKTGNMNLAVVGSNVTGNSIVRFKVQDKTYDVTFNGATPKTYGIATIQIEKPGYIRVDMQGVKKSGLSFGDVTGFRIGGQATMGANHFVTEEKMAEDELNCYWFRRGASVHWQYTMPKGNVEYFYNEVLVTEENARNSSYYMMNGFSEGYMGIQQTSNGEHKILFSVWSPYFTDDPSDIPEEKRVKLLRKGKNVTVGEFGNEGSGGQSWLHCGWNAGTVYKALVQVKPDGNGKTIYTAYFYADNEWKLIASFLRPDTDTWYKGAYSFLENFDPVNSIYTRSVLYKNQWVRLESGDWKEITTAKFTCDNTGIQGLRYDCSGSVDEKNCGFVLKSFGFSDDHTDYGEYFTRAPSGKAPDIDIEVLEKIPSVE